MSHKPKSHRPGPDSPYVKRERARKGNNPLPPVRPRYEYGNEDYQVLKDFTKDFREANGGETAAQPPPGADRFYRLPPHLRPQAHEYYRMLCARWAKRIQQTPGFARILHMITLNKFKNPGQVVHAGRKGTNYSFRRNAKRRRLFTDPEPTKIPAQIRHLGTF
jgi:hypothetical protein